MKVDRKTRAAAIRTLDLAASNYGTTSMRFAESIYDWAPNADVEYLMREAWSVTFSSDQASLAEAACLLREGWSPGDEVVLLGASK